MAATLPLGVVLAGGRSSRLAGAKATAELRGRPLICYPLAALRAALGEAVVLCKPETKLPALLGVEVRFEREALQHPLVGIRAALELARGRSALVCAADLPLVSPGLIAELASAWPGATAVVASHRGEMQPLLGRYSPAALSALGLRGSVREAVRALSPRLLEVQDPVALFNVNTPAELERAADLLRARGC